MLPQARRHHHRGAQGGQAVGRGAGPVCVPTGKAASQQVADEAGPDHAKVFRARVMLVDEVWGEGEGSSKKEAEQQAAEAAYRAATLRQQGA